MSSRVMSEPCSTCIFRKDQRFDLPRLLDQIRDKHVGFRTYRQCHHAAADGGTACCRGFWNAHKDDFAAGQLAQRLGIVVEIQPSEELS